MEKKVTELVFSGVKLEDYFRTLTSPWCIMIWNDSFIDPPKSLNVVGVAVCNDGVWWVVER